ncbi:MAG: SAM-dependent methyltransferase [Lachnospiraceae bacterium]|jgi:tRNA (adenine22-N1)-methyltransferase|nr:SAM-dependent methyltransferase [Lachnospiraceae bacterium]
MHLSNRLQAVADLVTPGNRVADIGCDHAYISIYLVEHKISPHVIAMDVNQGPIDRAKENIKKYGYAGRIETRRSDGLEKLNAGEADAVLIAGMGGGLTIQILTRYMDVTKSLKELILQPQSEIHLVRRAVREMGFTITEENMMKEDGKYYVMMRAEANAFVADKQSYEPVGEEHDYFGRLLLERRNPVLREFLWKEEQRCRTILKALEEEPTENSLERQREVKEMLERMDMALGYYRKGLGS